ncbi:hypothetical protein SAMN05421640_1904 [Ekhidna lutea]|uniref:Uncharacterized protein n=1 Tax=Ekhidna lutea TaxID=447679 RepID=A0A239IYU1_EKHLU|nr:hypothetical protein [Ekhidna lutea]SNS98797.1 hypothetical protein SAMN05421640_1904 [Ekhidna lutea]
MTNQSNYIEHSILTRKFIKTGTLVRIISLGIAYAAILAMAF